VQQLLVILLFILGLLFIIKGSDFLIDSCLILSQLTSISKIVIGATLVGIATSLPEISVSLIAVGQNLHHMAVGNAIGSMICNVALITGAAIVIAPQRIALNSFKSKAFLLIILNFVLFLFCLNLKIRLVESVILLSICGSFFYVNIIEAKKSLKEHQKNKTNASLKKDWLILILQFIIGVSSIFVGANMLVDNGERIAFMLNMGSEIVGLTVIAFSTSLPELITTIAAVKKKSMDLVLGNIIGTNIINITLLFGLGGVLAGSAGLNISKSALLVSIPLLIFITLMLVLPILKTAKTNRIQGVLLVTTYIFYTLFILSTLILGL
jgi:cation:H+ antiporter